MEKAGPFAPNAREALKEAAHARNRESEELLRETILAAIWLVALRGEEPERIREDREWVKNRDGEVVEVIPARQYGPASTEFQHWFESRVRTLVEHEILELADRQPAERRGKTYGRSKTMRSPGLRVLPTPFYPAC
jgi:hypothetical protein